MKTFTSSKKQISIATILFCIYMLSISNISSAQIFQPEGLNMPGAYNGFTNPPSNLKFANANQTAGGQLNINSSLAGQVIWQTKFSAAASGGDIVGGNYDFLFTSGAAGNYYQNKWGGVSSWTLNTPNNVYIGGGQPNDNCTFTNGKFYTVNWLDLGYNDTKACIMETGASPATISTVSNSSPCAGASTLVSFTLSVTPSAQEIFYVRWSIDNFTTSSLVTATTVGVNGSATIPGQISGTTVKYYVFSSTVSSGNIATDYDLCTININGNGGLNFSYTVPTISISETHINPSCAVPNSGSIDITVTGGTPLPATQIVTQNFNTLALSGTSSTLPSGWLLSESGSSANTTYTAGTGSSATGDTYSFGPASNSDRAFGGLQSGSVIPTIGAVFTNTTGSTVTSISISYTGEQWRLGATARVDRMDFQYSTNATSLTTGTWTDFDALDFTAPVTAGTVGALDGNAAANKTSKSGTISSLSIANGATVYIRWNDLNATGSDDGLGVDDFTATLISSGPGTYNFAWSNGATTEDISSIIANTYTVTVTDANTCTATKSIIINPAAGISLSETHNNVSCNGGSNGSIDLTATGGTGSYTYFWSNGFILQDISSLTAGTYTVTVSDGSCTSNLSVTLTAPPAIVISETHNNISCNAATDGSINLTVSGGAGGFLFSWSNGATSEDLTGLSADFYNVTVTDASGCQNFATVEVTEPLLISLSETHINVNCNGAATGSIDLNVSGGTPLTTIPYTQNFNTLALSGTGNAWVDNSTISNWYASRTTYNADIGSSTTGSLYSYGSTSNSERALGSLASGGTGTINYGVKIINTTGETVSSITVGYWGEQWRCGGNINQQKLDFTYQVNAIDISSGTWTDVNDLDFYSQVNNAIASSLDGNVEPNKYYVYGIFNVTLAAGDAIWLRYTDINDTGNDHGLGVDDLSVQLTTASGGYTYAWSNGSTTQDVSSLASNTYSVTVTDTKNCSATTSVSITEPDAISISGTQLDATCSNANNGSIDVSVSGGTPSYSFLWSNGETTEDIAALLPGDYTITVTDFNNCSSTLSFTIGSDQTATTWYADDDNDTYGDANDVIISCDQPAGYIANAGDCNDQDAFIYTEQTYYGDVDGDSFGDVGNTFTLCSNTPPSGYVVDATDCDDANYMYNDTDNDGYGAGDPVGCGVTNNTDCNDADANINPVAIETCNGIDDDCANGIDDGLTFVTYYVDADGDSYGDVNDVGISLCANPGAGYSTDNTDCNDADNSIHPNQSDLCNAIDDDCDGNIDEDAIFTTYYVDADGDSYGDVNDAGISLCANPGAGYSIDNTDCNDGDGSVHPSQSDLCNAIDDDCDGSIDEDAIFTSYYVDADGDGYGNVNDAGISLCANPGAGYSTDNTDCNDGDGSVHPNQIDLCNATDDDCDGSVDEDATFVNYYADADGDTYGDLNDAGISLCANPGAGYSADNTDCNDAVSSIHPNQIDLCNSIDDDCDGSIDEDATFVNYYVDADGDGYGDVNDVGTSLCSNPGAGYSTDNTDCNDAVNSIHPNQIDLCNSIDDDCDAIIDEDAIFTTYYVDADGDTYGDLNDAGISLCANPGAGYSIDNTDCNDGDGSVHPSQSDLCNAIDDDCDGSIDEDAIFTSYYVDADGDGYGNVNDAGISLCANPGAGYSTDNTDCNDADGNIHPNQSDLCNSIDDDCDGSIDEDAIFTTYYVDADGDSYGDVNDADVSLCANPGAGYSTDNTDCNDADGNINPAAIETCNGIDDDCANGIDDGLTFITYYVDTDGDSYGDVNDAGISLCSNPGVGYSTDNTDCNDADGNINPAAIETCNGIDDDCANGIDDGLTFITYYVDADGDSYGDVNDAGTSLCSNPGAGYSTDNTDCNDADGNIHPDQIDLCNAIDDDCDGSIDEEATFVNYYIDADGDGYGDVNDVGTSSCSNPGAGYSTYNTDCNDAVSSIHPNQIDLCNAIDDDCDGSIDEEATFVNYYIDADGDGYGDVNDAGTSSCSNPGAGYSTDNTDCNDAVNSIHPSQSDLCNAIDDDCDGSVDEDATFVNYYIDADGDGYGDVNDAGTSSCSNPGAGYSTDNTDCNDAVNSIHPSQSDLCNAIDDDCDGSVDEDATFVNYYVDADGDGYGDVNDVGTSSCSNPGAGYSADNTDCNDGNAAIHPNAVDLCNSIDDNCNNVIDENAVAASISPPGTVTFCLGSTAQLTASPSGFGITYQWYRNNVLFAGQTNQVVNVSSNGTYSVAVSNGVCASTSLGTSAVKLKAGSVNITVIGNLDICTAGSVTLKCSSGSVTYQWNKGGLPISGATNQLYTATGTGDYSVTITSNINGCTKTSSVVTVFTSCKLEEWGIIEASMNLFPNPTIGNFIIEMNFSSSLTSDADVELINSLGQIVYAQHTAITNGKLQSEVKLNNDFAAGNYFVRVIVSDKVYNGIIIYQK